MAGKLKLILRLIPWSLAARAFLFGLAWLTLPFGLFLVVALYFYLVPLFKPLKFGWPFLALLVLMSPLFFEKTAGVTFIAATIFFLILGVKDLVLLRRKSSYGLAILGLSLILLGDFFYGVSGDFRWTTPFKALALSLTWFLLWKGWVDYRESFTIQESEDRKRAGVALGVAALMMWQVIWALLFLPLGYVSQTAVAFLAALVILELVVAHLGGTLSRRRILADFTIFFVFLTFALTSARWEL